MGNLENRHIMFDKGFLYSISAERNDSGEYVIVKLKKEKGKELPVIIEARVVKAKDVEEARQIILKGLYAKQPILQGSEQQNTKN